MQGIGGGFANTQELHVLKYNATMQTPDAPKWTKAVDEEHERMVKHHVWKAKKRDEIPPDAKILSSTWVLKKKADGAHRARVTAQGFEQIDGEHYDELMKAAPVVNDITICIILILVLIFYWYCEILDVKGAFLNGILKDN